MTYDTPPRPDYEIFQEQDEREQAKLERAEARKEDREYVSNCCSAHIIYQNVCSKCGEFCDAEEI